MIVAVRHPAMILRVQDALRTGLEVPVGDTVPSPRPSKFVTAALFGGTAATEVSATTRISVEAWATSPADAEELAQDARYVLHQMAGTVIDNLVVVYRVSDEAEPARLPHPTGQPRVTFTADIHVRSLT